jgi:hypothetical protein
MPVWYYGISFSLIGFKVLIPYVRAIRRDPGFLTTEPDNIDFLELL